MKYVQYHSLPEKLRLKYVRTKMNDGEVIPHWWLGRAYRNYDADTAVYWIIPLNLIIRKVREWLIWMRFPDPSEFEVFEQRRFMMRRTEFENKAYNKFLYTAVGMFTKKEMDLIEDMLVCYDIPEFERNILSDVHHNYVWLHKEYKDSCKALHKIS